MSKLAKRNKHCCNNNDVGIISLQVVDTPTATVDNVTRNEIVRRKAIASNLQNTYAPHLYEIPVQGTAEASHAHVTKRTRLAQLTEHMENENLTCRISHMLHGIDEQARCAELSTKTMRELLATGNATVELADKSGRFNLTANKKGIQDVHFINNN